MENHIIDVRNLSKKYPSGFHALKQVNLQIKRGEIFALLGPNGAGKTTLISIICGLVNVDEGQVVVGGFDVVKQYRQARKQIGLVPQELAIDVLPLSGIPWCSAVVCLVSRVMTPIWKKF